MRASRNKESLPMEGSAMNSASAPLVANGNAEADRPLALVSIIIPVYNVGEFLVECVESIQAQEYDNIEVLLVDDGSTDGSGALCDTLASESQKVVAIHQPNMGPSVARNTGVRAASGDYVAFIDSDDIVHPYYISELVAMLEGADADISSCGIKRFSDTTTIKEASSEPLCNSFRLYTWREYMDVLLKINGNRTVCYPVAKLYKASLFSGRDTFPSDIYHGEDVLATYTLVRSASTIVESSSRLYFYRKNATSITGGSFDSGFFQLYEVWSRISALARKEDVELRRGVAFNNDRVDFTILCDMLLKGSKQTDSLFAEERRLALQGLRGHYFQLLVSPLPINRKVAMTVLVVFGESSFLLARKLQSSKLQTVFLNRQSDSCNRNGRRQEMKTLFYIDTPNQLFNCIAYLTEVRQRQSVQADAVIALEFENAQELADKTQSYGLFANTHRMLSNPMSMAGTRGRRAFIKILALAGREICSYDTLPESWDYDQFVYCCPCIGAVEVVSRIRKAGYDPEIILVEDGAGTYSGNVFRFPEYIGAIPSGVGGIGLDKRFFKLVVSRFTRNRARLDPASMFVYRPDLMSYTTDFPIFGLSFSNEAAEVAKVIFSSGAEQAVLNSNIILFDVPRYSNAGLHKSGGADAMDALRDRLYEKHLTVYVKCHPRSDKEEFFRNNEIAFPKVNWEVACIDLNLEDLILVGVSSTAMCTPKIIFGKEPHLVILPSIQGQNSNARYSAMAHMLYDSGSRVFEPASIEEAVKIIEMLVQR